MHTQERRGEGASLSLPHDPDVLIEPHSLEQKVYLSSIYNDLLCHQDKIIIICT